MSYRLLFLDLDGTLVGRHDVVSPRNLAALKAANDAGCTVVICTARNRYMVERVAAQWTGHGYGIFANGAVIAEWETGLVLQKITVPPKAVREAIRTARECGLAMLLFGVHVEQDGGRAVYTDIGAPLFSAWESMHAHRVVAVDDLLAEITSPGPSSRGEFTMCEPSLAPVSMGVYGDREPVERMAEAWRDRLGEGVDIFCAEDSKYDGWCCYANATEANKATAAHRVAEMLNVPRERVMAIGDHVNDVDLLHWAGLGVCMGDGHVDARSAADHITAGQSDDGVADAIIGTLGLVL